MPATTGIAEYVVEKASVAVNAGLNLKALGQLRLGWHHTRWQPSLSTGLPVLQGNNARRHGLQASLEIDRLNRRFFPTDGWSLTVTVRDNNGEDRDFTRAAFDLRNTRTVNGWVLGSRLAWTGSPRGQLPVYDGASLGGFLNLSGYSTNQVAGDSMRMPRAPSASSAPCRWACAATCAWAPGWNWRAWDRLSCPRATPACCSRWWCT